MLFGKPGLIEPIVKTLKKEWHTTPKPIQELSVLHALAGKRYFRTGANQYRPQTLNKKENGSISRSMVTGK
jgi:hypothetical protein